MSRASGVILFIMNLHTQFHKAYDPDSLLETVDASVKITAEHAKAFLDWVSYLKGAEYAEKTTDELYKEWITQLGYE